MTSGDGGGNDTRPPFPWLPAALIAAGFLCLVAAGAFWVRAQQRAEAAAEAEAAARRAAASRPDTRTRAMPTPGGETTAPESASPRDAYRLPLAVAGAGLALDLAGSVLLVARKQRGRGRGRKAAPARRRRRR